MDRVITPSLSPIDTKLDVCKFDNDNLDHYSISIGATNYDYDGAGTAYHSSTKSYFVPIYDSLAPDESGVTKFLISADVYDNKTKIEQWELDFGDGTKRRGKMGPQSYIPSTESSLVPSETSAVTLADASEFPNSGIILINDEYISYESKYENTLMTLTRGLVGTTAGYHWNGASASGIASVTNSGLTLTDTGTTPSTSGAPWSTDQWIDQYVHINDSVAKITDNTDYELTVENWSADVPSGTQNYSIKTMSSPVKLVKEANHKYLYNGGGNSNGCLSATLKVMDTRGRRFIKRIMVYPKVAG